MNATDLKLPPHSIDAEQALLGGMLLSQGAIDRISDFISGKEFYRHGHQTIFATILGMAESGKCVDVITVAEELDRRAELEQVGGLPYLGSLAQVTPSAANIRHYAEIVYEKSVERDLLAVGMAIMDTAQSSGITTEEKIEQSQAAVMAVGERRTTNDPVLIGDALLPVIEKIDELYQSDSPISGLATGFDGLDEKTSGLQPGDLVIVAGRPSTGKTAFAMSIAEHVAITQQKPVAVFSLEMAREQLINRTLSAVGKIPLQHIRTGKLADDEWSSLTFAVGKLNDCPLIIDDTSAISLMQMRTATRKAMRKLGGLALVVVDYLGLMTGKGNNRNQELGSISRGLKALAKEMRVPVIALAQLNRDVESQTDKRPRMKDLRDSGEIEQDADIVVMLHREEYYNDDAPEWAGLAEMIVRKNRNGPLGDALLEYRAETITFTNTDKPNPRCASGNKQTRRKGMQ